jgi:hypothetical protein
MIRATMAWRTAGRLGWGLVSVMPNTGALFQAYVAAQKVLTTKLSRRVFGLGRLV